MSTPYDFEDGTRGHYARAIGYLTMGWATLEICLDFAIAIAFQRCGGNALEPEIPRSFSRKVTFLRKSFQQLESLREFETQGIALLDRASELSDTRHTVVHGAISAVEGAVIKLHRIFYSPQSHRAERANIELNDVWICASDVTDLAHQLADFVALMVSKFHGPEHGPLL
jgi:hypothetical protein